MFRLSGSWDNITTGNGHDYGYTGLHSDMPVGMSHEYNSFFYACHSDCLSILSYGPWRLNMPVALVPVAEVAGVVDPLLAKASREMGL